MFGALFEGLKFIFKRVTKLSIPYFSLEENDLKFKITSEYSYKFPISNIETKTRHDAYVVDAYTLKTKEIYVEYIHIYYDASWNGQALGHFLSLLKENIFAKNFDLVDSYEFNHYEFRTYFVDNSYYLNIIYLYENSKEIFIIDKKFSLFQGLLRNFKKNYTFTFDEKFNLDLDFSFSLVKKNATNNYFKVTSS
ncbi:hypothetical protein AFAEC_0736 [Aliarcobacter faecis]|uniref:hypothetical protein n=1 Tax=Aliarcobacter faecis TaxID=1564138 RepID=UPI00047BE738|nr:hypothetical protein [Aliarcobacter faecis]QKF72918.1 hypothetical protein AFAEC_0736 [Aliarcobacter faecis]